MAINEGGRDKSVRQDCGVVCHKESAEFSFGTAAERKRGAAPTEEVAQAEVVGEHRAHGVVPVPKVGAEHTKSTLWSKKVVIS